MKSDRGSSGHGEAQPTIVSVHGRVSGSVGASLDPRPKVFVFETLNPKPLTPNPKP